MINHSFHIIVEIIIGFAGGLAVGGGFVAFLTVLGIIPRLIQLSKTDGLTRVYGVCVIAGLLFGTYISFTNVTWNQPHVLFIIWGGFHGIFNGMLAAALTEVLNVFPIISKRIGMERYLFGLLMAIVFGKIAGSLFQWLIFVK
ncbi:stage V sporulation protein AB [Virgibacillus dakarensis]|uniref:Stage V sporulation protein AB n=1 Tax=Lentibacillus populi TaxID=1827502 RepID=A0A9W5TVW0_9BACI|nr:MULTISPECIES: stage V sporulation protein AB [Bacillaceae]MBT2214320.1 stage V sporulation protein AB [Virgibacillus dakarensis]MTW84997.1 stage V sporulation protein AB [Virgibacillus dakarensis]GGB33917.1 stage V sporulation protein AB [Lentibacillus populi]